MTFYDKIKVLLYGVLILGLFSCSRKHLVKNPYEALEAMQYAVAVEMLQYDYNRSKVEAKRAEMAFLLAFAYKKMNLPEIAAPWYQKAYRLGYGDKALQGYIQSLIWEENYREAISLYQSLQSNLGQSNRFRREVLILKQALLWKNESVSPPIDIDNLPLNSEYSDFSAALMEDDLMVFTSDRPLSKNEPIYKWTGNSFSNVFIASTDGSYVSPWLEQINSRDNDGNIAIHPLGEFLIFVRCSSESIELDATCKLMKLERSKQGWGQPVQLTFVRPEFNYGSPAWNEDGTILFFSSNMEGGMGNYDLYFSRFYQNKFSEPRNLGDRINTQGNEKFPTVFKDTLFFSSDYLPGMGGLDIFKSFTRYDSTWSPPINMKPPFNSGGDDFGLVVNQYFKNDSTYAQKGYFSSSRRNGQGRDDIYEYKINVPQTLPKQTETQRNIHIVFKTEYPLYDTTDVLELTVREKLPLPNVQIIIDSDTMNTDKKGIVIFEPSPATTYNFLISKQNYFTQKAVVSTEGITTIGIDTDTTIYRRILMLPIKVNKEVVIQDIYYDYDRWELRSDAVPALNRLYEMLLINHNLFVELSAHTDCRGGIEYNLELSAKRAKSVVDYLVQRGIDPKRLKSKGYGASQPVVSCVCDLCTEEEHQKNRRTTFKILSQ